MTRKQTETLPAATPAMIGLADRPAWASTPIDPADLNSTTCPRCARDVGPTSCRAVPAGWFCIRDGLFANGLTLPRDPHSDWTRAERDTDAAWATLLEPAGTRVDIAMEAHAAAQQAHHAALLRLQQLGEQTGEGGSLLVHQHGAGPIGTRPRRDADHARDLAHAREDVEDTGNALHDAEAELLRARVALTNLSLRRDRAMAAAGATGTTVRPRANTALGRIRDRILT